MDFETVSHVAASELSAGATSVRRSGSYSQPGSKPQTPDRTVLSPLAAEGAVSLPQQT